MKKKVFYRLVIAVVLVLLTSTSSSANSVISIVDTLGAATPATQFSVFGTGGISINDFQFAGPKFTLTQTTVITEIGGFVNNCKAILLGVPQCPVTLPLIVQIHPSINGVPDGSTVFGSFSLSHDDDPLVVSYESVQPGSSTPVTLTLEPGSYFALFGAQDDDSGFLLNVASNPFSYQAVLIEMGFLNPVTGDASASNQFGAVRILGIAIPPVTSATIDICLFADRPGSDDFLDIREGANVSCDVWSNSDVRIKPGATVLGDVVSRFEDVNLGMDALVEGDVIAGEDVKVREISTVLGNVTAIGDDVILMDGAEVIGNATAGDKVKFADTANVTGDVFESAVVSPPPVLSLPSIAVTAGGEDIRVASGETLSLSPGSYGKLRVREGATLILSSGHYAFTDVKVGPSAQLLLDLSLGALLFDVSGDLSLKELTQMEIISETGTAADILFRVTGEEVDLRDGGHFLGTFLAPNAVIELHEDASLIGALFGWEVDVEQRTTVVGMPALELISQPNP